MNIYFWPLSKRKDEVINHAADVPAALELRASVYHANFRRLHQHESPMARAARTTRRTHAERRSATQAAILSASLKLLIEDGYARFSASRVAARAGVSRGAQEHYYPKKIDLIAAATRFAMDEAVRHAQSLAASAARSSDPIEKFFADSEHFFFAPIYRAMIEIMIAARSDRALARVINPIVQDARRSLNSIWADTLDAAGYPREKAQQFIELTHYMMRGVFLVGYWLPYQIDRSATIDAWRSLAPSILQLGRPAARRRRSTRADDRLMV
jgi:AcrR family transcriptional regulator